MAVDFYLDLDGVLVNFVLGATKIFQVGYNELISRWEPGSYEMEKALGVSKKKFFNTLEEHGEEFWANLPIFPYALELYEHCESLGDVTILSAPTLDPSSASGKIRWLQRLFGRNFRDYILTGKKEKCANANSILIDDFSFNTEKFIERGGKAILFPTWFNSRHHLSKDPVNVIKEDIAILLENGKCQ